MKLNMAWMILLGLTTTAAMAQQVGQPSTAPSQEGSGTQQGGTNREQTNLPTRATPLSPLEPPKTVTRVPIPPEELGIKAGPFQLYPDLNAGLTYDTNLFATRTNEVKDWMYSVTPSLVGRSESDKYEVNFRVGASANRYQDNSRQNTDDYWLEGQGTYKLSDKTNVYAGLGYTRSHEDRGSPDLSFGIQPTVFYDTSLFAGMFHDFGKGYARFGVAGSRLNFNNVETSTPGVLLINTYRDRDVNSVGGRLGFRISPTTDLFVQGVSEKRNYLNTPDSLGVTRNSTGTRIDVGAAVNFNQRLIGEAYVGQLRQEYSDSRFATVDAADYGASLRWHTSPWTIYRFSIDRTLDETVIAGASGYLNTSGTASVEHDLGNRTLVTAGLTAGKNNFQGAARIDSYSEASVGIKHYVNNAVYLGADYRYLSRSSDTLAANYDRNFIMFTVGSDFGARRRNRYFAYEEQVGLDFESARRDFGGLYAGAQYGVGGLNSVASGLRDLTAGNTDQGQLGHDGNVVGLFVGYGKMFNKWYLGVELEANNGDGKLSHDHNSGATPAEPLRYTIAQKAGYGVGLRAGYALESGSMLYGRLGLMQTTFNNNMVVNDGTFNQDHTQSGRKIGIGAEVPAGDDMFLRFEYTHTKYDDYHMVTTNYDELYQNSTGYFNIGLGWRFGGQKQETASAPVDPKFLRGVYAGAQLGHGSLNTSLSATHYHAGPPAYNDPLVADFGAAGMSSGVYLGYGHTVNRVYLGVELDAEPSQGQWKHDRVTSGGGGRDFSVSKKGSFGAALRAGYVLANGAMVYGRFGGVNTKFNTKYERGSSGLVDRDDTLAGTRVGMGVELPINKEAFWRLDYSVTNYSATPTFSSPGGTPDVVSMTNREDLFRVGLGVRF